MKGEDWICHVWRIWTVTFCYYFIQLKLPSFAFLRAVLLALEIIRGLVNEITDAEIGQFLHVSVNISLLSPSAKSRLLPNLFLSDNIPGSAIVQTHKCAIACGTVAEVTIALKWRLQCTDCTDRWGRQTDLCVYNAPTAPTDGDDRWDFDNSKVDMTLRTLPEGFCPKRGCCLAMSKQKWRENENLRFSYFSIEIMAFLNNCVSNAVNWVPRPERHALSIGTLIFSWNVTVFAIESL